MGQYYKPMTLNKSKNEPTAWFATWDFNNGLKLMEHSYVDNWVTLAVETLLLNNPQPLAWAGDYSDTGLYDKCQPDTKVDPTEYDELLAVIPKTRYCVNHDKKEYVKVEKNESHTIHPLPLLTWLSDEEAGGDYHSEAGREYLGTWATDTIEVTDTAPEGYTLIDPNFKED